ncbi:type II toxin-antitoxin system HipA family toxin [Microbacterium sediminicola]|uniref:Type II toxin-antitoxin system HipA family toxin n=1 Tax=Microbacterium sediminicola TaxID=415210 RepID=A0ABP4UNV1_9MICO
MVTANALTQRVWVDLAATPDDPEAHTVGWMDVVTVAERAVAVTFHYDESYLDRPGAFAVSTELPLTDAPITVGSMPGSFVDASADSWCQKLIRRQLRAQGTWEMNAVDALLGVSDDSRYGALRFRDRDGYAAVSPAPGVVSAPISLDMRDLRRAAKRVERGVIDADAAIEDLLDAGTALWGGARPKAFVRRKGHATIAKFSAPDDEHDAIRWEMVSLALARRAGIPTARVRRATIGERAVLLAERFDRVGRTEGAGAHELRVPFVSLRTIIGEGHDYLDVAEVVRKYGGSHARDHLRELWRRVAFLVAVHCVDDHSRNGGFLRRGGEWHLCPMYDVEPDPHPERQRSTSIMGVTDPEGAPAALVALAAEFGLKKSSWRLALRQVLEAVDAWPDVAAKVGLEGPDAEEYGAAVTLQRPALAALLG